MHAERNLLLIALVGAQSAAALCLCRELYMSPDMSLWHCHHVMAWFRMVWDPPTTPACTIPAQAPGTTAQHKTSCSAVWVVPLVFSLASVVHLWMILHHDAHGGVPELGYGVGR